MFTGIIEDIGEVKIKQANDLTIFSVLEDIRVADSIAVNGVCLTVEKVEKKQNGFFFKLHLSQETLHRTNLKFLTIGSKVNLERALKLNSKLSGHILTGHVDGVVKIREIKNETYVFELPQKFKKYIVEKGSIALDGISLTVAKKSENTFSVAVIPYTLNNTTLKYKKVGDLLNLEVDILAKYIESIFTQKDKKINLEFLKQHGFV